MNSLLRSDLTPCTWNTEIKSDSIVKLFQVKNYSPCSKNFVTTSTVSWCFLFLVSSNPVGFLIFFGLYLYMLCILQWWSYLQWRVFLLMKWNFTTLLKNTGSKEAFTTTIFEAHSLDFFVWLKRLSILWQQLTFICNRPPPRCSTPPNGGWHTVFDIKSDMSFPRKWNFA